MGNGQMTIAKIKQKLQRGTGFPPTPMPEAELNAYISALEAHLNGGASSEPAPKPTTNLPELNSKQKIDLKMIQNGQMTIAKIKQKLQRGTGFPPTPMPEAELNAYISALE